MTTTVPFAALLRAETDRPHTDLAWDLVALAAAVLAVLLLIGWMLYARALRVDRLHRQVLGSRATLEAELVHRAQAAAELASTGMLDPASSVLLSRAAHDAIEAEGPLVDDGLDHEHREEPPPARPRAMVESDLTRVIRTIAQASVRSDLAATPLGEDCLARLDRASYRLGLARRFHNTHVAEARRLRSEPLVRVLHLAGHAPMPATFDIDDDTSVVSSPDNPDRTTKESV